MLLIERDSSGFINKCREMKMSAEKLTKTKKSQGLEIKIFIFF
jgi:hypothetical protein